MNKVPLFGLCFNPTHGLERRPARPAGAYCRAHWYLPIRRKVCYHPPRGGAAHVDRARSVHHPRRIAYALGPGVALPVPGEPGPAGRDARPADRAPGSGSRLPELPARLAVHPAGGLPGDPPGEGGPAAPAGPGGAHPDRPLVHPARHAGARRRIHREKPAAGSVDHPAVGRAEVVRLHPLLLRPVLPDAADLPGVRPGPHLLLPRQQRPPHDAASFSGKLPTAAGSWGCAP